jgi:hypothetical protein
LLLNDPLSNKLDQERDALLAEVQRQSTLLEQLQVQIFSQDEAASAVNEQLAQEVKLLKKEKEKLRSTIGR